MTWLLILASLLAQGEAGNETMTGKLYEGHELVLTIDGSDTMCHAYLAQGHGVLACTDSRRGAFSYYLDDTGGIAHGRLDGVPLVLVFE